MTNWKKYLIVGSIGFFLGSVAIGTFVGFIVHRIDKSLYKPTECPEQKENGPAIITTTTSGKKGIITYHNWNYKGPYVCFTTKSTGTAEEKTSINKQYIPEAYKWMKYNGALQFSYMGLFVDDTTYNHVFGVSYLHRWNWFAIGAGPVFTYTKDNVEKKIVYGGGFQVMAQVWFKVSK